MSWNLDKEEKNRICRCYLKSKAGMTLTEMLAAMLILSMTATAVGGGVVVVKDAYKKVTDKAEAQQVLATTVELITDFLSEAQKVNDKENTNGPAFYSGETKAWMRLVSVPYEQSGARVASEGGQAVAVGICKAYNVDKGGSSTEVPLLTEEAMGGIFYTDFKPTGSSQSKYSYSNGYFTVENINVYYKTDANNPNRVPMAHLDKLVVRAVNMEGQN